MSHEAERQNSTEIGTHLPECPMADPSPARRNRCLCPVLHACESRVREDERVRLLTLSDKVRESQYAKGRADAAADVAALDEAVPFSSDVDALISQRDAIAAARGGTDED